MLLVGPQVPLHTFSYAFAGLLSKDKTWQLNLNMLQVVQVCTM